MIIFLILLSFFVLFPNTLKNVRNNQVKVFARQHDKRGNHLLFGTLKTTLKSADIFVYNINLISILDRKMKR